MKPVVTIDRDEYEQLLKFKKDRTVIIELWEKTAYSSRISHSSDLFIIRVNDPNHDDIQLHNKLDSFIQRYERVKKDIIDESIELDLLQKQIANVPSWIVRIFNRKKK